MQVFIQVVESGNFTRAAEVLGMPRSSVSTEIQLLEDRLQAQLLLRTTRKVTPTQDGLRFHDTALEIVNAVTASELMFCQAEMPLSGCLRVDLPSRIAKKIVIPALPGLLREHPELNFEVSASDRLVDLVVDGVDCALRLGTPEDSELICRRIGSISFVTCASQAYLSQHGVPLSLAELSAHVMVNYATRLPGSPASLDFMQAGREVSVAMQSDITVDNAETYIEAALAGLGLIQVPAYDIDDWLGSGELVEVLPEHRPPSEPLSFVYVHRRNLAPRVRFFQHWLEQKLEEHGVIAA